MIYLCRHLEPNNQYFTAEHVYKYREGFSECIVYVVNSTIYDDILQKFTNVRDYLIDTLYCTFLSDIAFHKGILGRDAKYYYTYKFPIKTYTNHSVVTNLTLNINTITAHFQ